MARVVSADLPFSHISTNLQRGCVGFTGCSQHFISTCNTLRGIQTISHGQLVVQEPTHPKSNIRNTFVAIIFKKKERKMPLQGENEGANSIIWDCKQKFKVISDLHLRSRCDASR
jgi:hypothetical protein